jgi:ketosteroid isomerase-like protein
MRTVMTIVLLAFWVVSAGAQPADANLKSELEAIHAKWYQAFDRGDGATMNDLEVSNLALVAPVGVVWIKSSPRAAHEAIGAPGTRHVLSDVTVRRFGDTAILTGIHTTVTGKDTSRVATTVVFVRQSGRWRIASAQWTPITVK